MTNKDRTESILTCKCGCDDGIRLAISKDDDNHFAYLSYFNGAFYQDQDDTILRVIRKKWNKIKAVLFNKDFYYAEIVMNRNDFEEFKEFVNNVE